MPTSKFVEISQQFVKVGLAKQDKNWKWTSQVDQVHQIQECFIVREAQWLITALTLRSHMNN